MRGVIWSTREERHELSGQQRRWRRVGNRTRANLLEEAYWPPRPLFPSPAMKECVGVDRFGGVRPSCSVKALHFLSWRQLRYFFWNLIDLFVTGGVFEGKLWSHFGKRYWWRDSAYISWHRWAVHSEAIKGENNGFTCLFHFTHCGPEIIRNHAPKIDEGE